jgi:hypothetical protein
LSALRLDSIDGGTVWRARYGSTIMLGVAAAKTDTDAQELAVRRLVECAEAQRCAALAALDAAHAWLRERGHEPPLSRGAV